MQHIVCTGRWRIVHIDMVGPLATTKDGYTQVLTIMDRFSRFVRLVALKTAMSHDIAKAFYTNWVCTFGVPEALISDNGPQLECPAFHTVCQMFGVEKRRTTEYHPQTNGVLERMHAVMKYIIKAKIGQYDDWVAALPHAEFVINTAINDHGVSPSMVMFGEQPPMPLMMFRKPLPLGDVTSPTKLFVYRLSHNLREMRKLLLKMDQTISPYTAPWEGIPIKFNMVYVEVPGRFRGSKPRYEGPAIVLSNRDKVLTIKYLNGEIKKVNIERVRPIHKLREDMADLKVPVPSRILYEEAPAGNVASDSTDPHDQESMKFFATAELPGSLALTSDDREELLTQHSVSATRKSVAISFFQNEGRVLAGEPGSASQDHNLVFHETPGPDRTTQNTLSTTRRSSRKTRPPGWTEDFVTQRHE